MGLLGSILTGLGVACAVLLGAGALLWKAHGPKSSDRPDVLITVVGVIAVGVLYLASLLLIGMLPVPLQDHALGTCATVFGGLAVVIAGGHTLISAAGGGGIMGITKSLFTAQQPYSQAPFSGSPLMPGAPYQPYSPSGPSQTVLQQLPPISGGHP